MKKRKLCEKFQEIKENQVALLSPCAGSMHILFTRHQKGSHAVQDTSVGCPSCISVPILSV